MQPSYQRILLKLSGETLGGTKGFGFDYEVVQTIAENISKVHDLGVAVGVVVGGGNIFRGARSAEGHIGRVAGDHMGMMATVINSICLQEVLEQRGVNTRVMSAIDIRAVAEPYIKRRADRHLEKSRVVIFAAGTGNPFFTTDTAAALRAMEINAEVILKGTKVDGIYDKDPVTHPDAVKFDEITYLDVLNRELTVMDSTAISLCKDNHLPIITFNLFKPGNIKRVVCGDKVGTLVK